MHNDLAGAFLQFIVWIKIHRICFENSDTAHQWSFLQLQKWQNLTAIKKTSLALLRITIIFYYENYKIWWQRRIVLSTISYHHFFLSPKDHHFIIFLTLLHGKHSTATQFRFFSAMQCLLWFAGLHIKSRDAIQQKTASRYLAMAIWPWRYLAQVGLTARYLAKQMSERVSDLPPSFLHTILEYPLATVCCEHLR